MNLIPGHQQPIKRDGGLRVGVSGQAINQLSRRPGSPQAPRPDRTMATGIEKTRSATARLRFAGFLVAAFRDLLAMGDGLDRSAPGRTSTYERSPGSDRCAPASYPRRLRVGRT